MLTTVLPLLLIITARAGTCAGLCVLENGTRARCQALEDIRYIETYDLEPLKAHVREPILRSSTVFANFTGLRHLDLSTGSLERIEAGSFLRLSNLRSLNLAENRIRDIETGSLDGLDRLHTLNLRGNRLRHLPPELARLNLLQHLDLQGNPLRCDCATLDTRDLLTARGVRFEGNVVCASPANSRGIPLLRLDAALVCRFEEQDLLGMQNDQADQSSYDSSGDSPGKRYDEDEKEEVLEELEEEEEKEEEEEESTEIVETTIRAESETPFREIDSPPASTPFLEEVEPPSTLGDSSTPTSTEEVASKGESEPSKKTTAFASEKIHEDGLFYPTEGSGAEDEEEGEEEQGEGSGVEGSGSGPTSTHPSREGKGEDEGFSLFDGLYNIIWGTTEGTTNEGPDLEEEQFIDATPTKGEKEVEEEEEEEDKASTTSTTTTTTTTVSSLSTEIILVPGVKFVDNSSKSGNVKMEEGEGDELASPTRQSKKGMGSYVVLAALLAILATLIGFAAYKGGFCRRRRKRGDVENGTELKDMQKALLETANTGAQAKVASNGNVESAPLVVDHPVDQTFDQDEIKVSNDCRTPDTGAKRSAVPRSPSRGGRSRRDSIDGGASREEDRVQQQPPLSPGAQRVKITVQENPDSVPKTPILITRTSNGENLVKTP